MNIHVVIVAAGIGSRFGHDATPKQYQSIGDKTVLAHSVSAFDAIDCQQIMIALHPEDVHWADTRIESRHPINTCPGGDSRRDSVLNALHALHAHTDDWVMVHDAARCCVRQADLLALQDHLAHHPFGGLLVKPITDTIKQSSDHNGCDQTIDRDHLYAALTPQMFKFGLLTEALTDADPKRTTDEASAFEQKGMRPHMVKGHGDNIKITHRDDLSLAAFYLKQQGRH